MTFLAPGFFLASLAIAAGVIALHFIVTKQPRAGILPTARFVPDLPATATARATRPSDILLMLLRVLLVLLAGAGLAKPVYKPSRGAESRVILADVSRAVRDTSAVRDSVRALYRSHDALVVFDSSARVIANNATDSIGSLRFGKARGNLSAALIAAMRAGSSLRETADSLELVVISPVAEQELDAATESIRALWPGRARIVRAGSVRADSAVNSLDIIAAEGDPIRITAASLREDRSATALIARIPGADSAQSSVRAVVEWPASGRPPRAIARAKVDTIGGVMSGNVALIAAFDRRWTYPPDSIRGAEVVARWIDGEAAAIEMPGANGCTRSVAIPVSPAGDLVIRGDFQKLVGQLAGDCAVVKSATPGNAAAVASLTGSGGLAPREAFKPRGDVRSSIAPWLLGLAIAVAIAEIFVRRRRQVAAGNESRRVTRDARQAA